MVKNGEEMTDVEVESLLAERWHYLNNCQRNAVRAEEILRQLVAKEGLVMGADLPGSKVLCSAGSENLYESEVMNKTVQTQETKTEQLFLAAVFKGKRFIPITICADFGPISVLAAIEQYREELRGEPKLIVCHTEDFTRALEIVPTFGIEIALYAAPILNKFSWFVAGDEGVVYSEGA